MNGRIEGGDTPEARLAAVIMAVLKARPEEEYWKLDYADFEEALRPYIQRELLSARMEELRLQRQDHRSMGIGRESALVQELMDVEKIIVARTGGKSKL